MPLSHRSRPRTARSAVLIAPRLLAAAFVVAILASSGATSLAPAGAGALTKATLNAAGGNTPTDGLRVVYAGAQFQVWRDGAGQLYSDSHDPASDRIFNEIALGVGDPTNGGTTFAAPEIASHVTTAGNVSVVPWDHIETVQTSDSEFHSTLTGTLGALTYTVNLTVTYTAPSSVFDITYSVVVPEGNAAHVQLYHTLDSYLGGGDAGPGFYKPDCGNGSMVGVDKSIDGVVEALQYVSGAKWSSYISAYYDDVVFSDNGYGPGYLNGLTDEINTDPENDNGFGINWDLGTAAGTTTSTAALLFADRLPICTNTEFVNPPATFTPGVPFTLTAQVTTDDLSVATGIATIFRDGVAVCTAPVVDGSVSCEVTADGSSAVFTAAFTGTGAYSNSSSAELVLAPVAPVVPVFTG